MTLTKITYVCRFSDFPTQLVLTHSSGHALSEAQAQFSLTPLESARINHLLLRDDEWCHCTHDHTIPNEVYFRDPDSGYHGWMCCTCRRVTQTG